MKFVHVSDLHLGFQTYPREEQDLFKGITHVFDTAFKEGIKLVIIAGDIFDRRDPLPQIQKGFAGVVSKAVREGVNVFMITGNHEGAPFSERNIHLDVYSELDIPGVTVSKIPNIYRMCGLNIISLPYPFKRNLLSREEYREKSETEVLQTLNDKLLLIEGELLKDIDGSLPTLLVAHIPILEGKMNDYSYSRFDAEIPISVEAIDREPFSYIALGHYHKMQFITSRRFGHPFVYAGSLDRITFSEENDPKGFYVVDIDEKSKKASFDFRENCFARKFYTIEVRSMEDIRNADMERAKTSITRIAVFEDIEDESKLEALARDLSEVSLAFTGILDRRERKRTFISSGYDLSISPDEAIQKYLDNNDEPFVKENYEEILKEAKDILSEIRDEEKAE